MAYLTSLLLLCAVALFFYRRSQGSHPQSAGVGRKPAPPSLAAQIARFKEIGLSLSPDVGESDIRLTLGDGDIKWDQLFWVYGVEAEEEPWDRRMSPDVWNFDHEFIEGPESYEVIVANHVSLAGRPDLYDTVHVDMPTDLDARGAPVTVTLRGSGTETRLSGQVDNDWASAEIVVGLRADIETRLGDGRRFWFADNGQAEVLAYLTDGQAAALNQLQKGLLRPAA